LKKNLLIILTSYFLITNFAQAETMSYPGDDPVFSVSFPESWNLETEDDVLNAMPADESIYLGIWALEDVDDVEEALDAIAEDADNFFKDLQVEDPGETEINGIPFIFVDGKGVLEDDTAVTVSLAVFSPDGETFFIGLFFGPPDMFKEHREEIDSIVQSVRAVK